VLPPDGPWTDVSPGPGGVKGGSIAAEWIPRRRLPAPARPSTLPLMTRLSLRRASCALATSFAALLVAATTGEAATFATGSAWDAPVDVNTALAPNSSNLVAELGRQVAAAGTYVNTTSYSTPVYTVGAMQPTVKVTLDTSYSPLQQDLLQVPIPTGAAPAMGADAHMVVRQPATGTTWEFWHASLRGDGWHARWGGKMTNMSANAGYFTAPFGATATGLPLLGGLMTRDELQAGRIDHALALAIPTAKAGSFVWPAQRSDGVATGDSAIPEGTRFRVDPSFDVDKMAAGNAVKAMVRAAQRYGMIVRDQSGCVTFYAEDPTPWGTNPYATLFGTRWLDGSHALKAFPWSRVQVVAPGPDALAAAGSAASTAPAIAPTVAAPTATPTTASAKAPTTAVTTAGSTSAPRAVTTTSSASASRPPAGKPRTRAAAKRAARAKRAAHSARTARRRARRYRASYHHAVRHRAVRR